MPYVAHGRWSFSVYRLAEVAFKAQDEAAGLRKQLRELEQKKQDKERETHANAGTADDGVPRLDGEVGFHRHAGTGEAAQEVMPSGRELEQELEVRAAQEETRHAKVSLEAARAKVKKQSTRAYGPLFSSVRCAFWCSVAVKIFLIIEDNTASPLLQRRLSIENQCKKRGVLSRDVNVNRRNLHCISIRKKPWGIHVVSEIVRCKNALTCTAFSSPSSRRNLVRGGG